MCFNFWFASNNQPQEIKYVKCHIEIQHKRAYIGGSVVGCKSTDMTRVQNCGVMSNRFNTESQYT
jgi:hypothetical protein